MTWTKEQRARINARAKVICAKMKPTCSCGGDERDPGWHHEGCSLEDAWDRAMSEAKEEEYIRQTGD